jgi:hypothetical protein
MRSQVFAEVMAMREAEMDVENAFKKQPIKAVKKDAKVSFFLCWRDHADGISDERWSSRGLSGFVALWLDQVMALTLIA